MKKHLFDDDRVCGVQATRGGTVAPGTARQASGGLGRQIAAPPLLGALGGGRGGAILPPTGRLGMMRGRARASKMTAEALQKWDKTNAIERIMRLVAIRQGEFHFFPSMCMTENLTNLCMIYDDYYYDSAKDLVSSVAASGAGGGSASGSAAAASRVPKWQRRDIIRGDTVRLVNIGLLATVTSVRGLGEFYFYV